MTKETLRQIYRKRRGQLTPAERQTATARITDATLAALEGRGRVFVYVGVRGEFDTRPLIRALLDASVEVAVPRIEQGGMVAAHLQSLEDLVVGSFGIPTTTGASRPHLDACVAPGIAFTRSGVRLGQGGGYYDRFFVRHPNLWRISPAFEVQIAPHIPTDPHDIPVHLILTEQGPLSLEGAP
jgi:5-formyltetrahydrofolate cyclo-ligase